MMWYIYTRYSYSAIKQNEKMPFAATQMDLGIIILSEINQPREDKYTVSLMCGILKNDTYELIYKTKIDPQTQKTN